MASSGRRQRIAAAPITAAPIAVALVAVALTTACRECPSSSAPPTAQKSQERAAGGAESSTAVCGGYAWGATWQGAPRSARSSVKQLTPAGERIDCGPDCRQVTTRLNFAAAQPYELHFAGGHMVSRAHSLEPEHANYVELQRADEVELTVEVPPHIKGHGYAQVLMGPDHLGKQLVLLDQEQRRSYVCEVALDGTERRLLAAAEGAIDDRRVDLVPVAADARYLVLSQGGRLFALDTQDGSEHPLEPSRAGISQVSVAAPYIVYATASTGVQVVDTRDWSRRRLGTSTAHHASSDGVHVVWTEDPTMERAGDSQIVVHDLRSGAQQRVAHKGSPSRKHHPTVEGDWVAWMDDRHSTTPGGPPDQQRLRLDIYGVYLPSGEEHHLVGESASRARLRSPILPRLHRGHLYVVAQAATNAQLFEVTLPATDDP